MVNSIRRVPVKADMAAAPEGKLDAHLADDISGNRRNGKSR